MITRTVGGARHEQLVRWRHELHQIPETAFAEHATSDYVASVLRDLGFDVTTGIGGTGVVASLTRGTSGYAIGLRAELDALPLTEDTDRRPYASRHPGAMHACGHDGHMAMVLGAAAVLAEEGGFTGTVRTVFQPAEEPGRGARAMIDDGLLDDHPLDVILGIHNIPGLPAGRVHLRPGPVMAGEDDFHIHITGRGGHASAPHLLVDPIVVAAQLITALQTVTARNVDPMHHAVVSCTDIRTDGARNAIPGNVHITGDTRTFDDATSQLVEHRIRHLTDAICAAHGARGHVTYTREFAPTVNDPAATAVAAALGADDLDDACSPIMASEDFGILARHVPAVFAFLGNGTQPGHGATPLHSPEYDVNDDILDAGVDYYVRLVRGWP